MHSIVPIPQQVVSIGCQLTIDEIDADKFVPLGLSQAVWVLGINTVTRGLTYLLSAIIAQSTGDHSRSLELKGDVVEIVQEEPSEECVIEPVG